MNGMVSAHPDLPHVLNPDKGFCNTSNDIRCRWAIPIWKRSTGYGPIPIADAVAEVLGAQEILGRRHGRAA
jgi:hypothetical protein